VEITEIIHQMLSCQDNNIKEIYDHLSSSLLINNKIETHLNMVRISNLPTDMIVEIFGFLDQDTLMEASLISKNIHDILKNKKMILLVFEVRSESWNKKEFPRTQHSLFSNSDTAAKLQRYPILRIVNYNTCGDRMSNDDILRGEISYDEIESIVKWVRRNNRFTALELISTRTDNPSMFIAMHLPKMLPNLQVIYVSDVLMDLCTFSRNCSLIEKITLHSKSHQECIIDLEGRMMKDAINLKEIIIDGVKFDFSLISKPSWLFNLNDHKESFLFHHCCKNLERVSFRNVKWHYACHDVSKNAVQKTLIKFVLNSSMCLRRLQSDLIPENMAMLRLKRPGVDLLN